MKWERLLSAFGKIGVATFDKVTSNFTHGVSIVDTVKLGYNSINGLYYHMSGDLSKALISTINANEISAKMLRDAQQADYLITESDLEDIKDITSDLKSAFESSFEDDEEGECADLELYEAENGQLSWDELTETENDIDSDNIVKESTAEEYTQLDGQISWFDENEDYGISF